MNRCSPKVVQEDVGDRRLWPQVSVVFYCTNVIEHKTTVETVVVDEDAGKDEQGSEAASRCLRGIFRGLGCRREAPPAPASTCPHRCRHHTSESAHAAHSLHCKLSETHTGILQSYFPTIFFTGKLTASQPPGMFNAKIDADKFASFKNNITIGTGTRKSYSPNDRF